MIPTQHTLDTPYPVGPVHCYSCQLNGDLVLCDTGPPTEEAKNYLRSNLDLDKLRHVVVTHCHIDHYGLAAWLEQETDASLYLPFRDSLKIKHHRKRLDQMIALLAKHGFDRQYLDLFRDDMDNDSVFPEFPKKFDIIEEDLPAELGISVLACPGHSQSDLVLTSDSWAITGDTLLRGIFQSPLFDVDLLTGERFGNYRAYCSSLVKLASLRGKQILPGHRQHIESIDTAIHFYVGKLLDRAARVREFSGQESIATLVARLFPHLDHPFMIYLKASELCFLQDFFSEPDLLQSALEQIGLLPSLQDEFQKAVAA